jgi:hypothetical protein
MSIAVVRHATTTVVIIEGDQVKQADDLVTEDGRKILIVKGGNSQKLVARVLTEFSQHVDRAGKPFTMSRSERGIMHTDPYGLPVRISGKDLEEFYLNKWFVYAELVHSVPPRSGNSPVPTGPNSQYLLILDKLPAFTVALLSQSRLVTRELVSLFEVID